MKILVACERYGRVRDAFRKRGHDAWSCDTAHDKSGDNFYHIQTDVINLLDPFNDWDMMIAFPPCTYLSVAGAAWLKRRPERTDLMKHAALFFQRLLEAPIPKIAIENPVLFNAAKEIIGHNYDQIIEPYMFGEPFKKRTCLWLKNLPRLKPTKVVTPETYWVNSTSNCRNGAKCSNKGKHRSQDKRGITFQGIADAMAKQWG